MRQPAPRTKPRTADYKTFPAPVDGWIANINLATPNARMPNGATVMGAAVLENWFPTATGIRMRSGSQRYAIVSQDGSAVTALFTYINGNNEKLFSATATDIYDITTVTNADDQFLVDANGNPVVDDDGNFLVKFSSPDSAVTSLTGGDWSVVQFATSGGTYLRCVNGKDTPLVFDGTDWGTTPAITVATPTTLSFVWVYKERLFFIQKDTLDAWYLPVSSIGGAAVKLPLGGVFSRGGSLLFGATWSLDTGSGLNEQCIFVTTEGEVAVYQGTDPSSATTWSKVNVYRIGRPRGANAHIKAGGDLVIATDIGFIPLSQAIRLDIAALAPNSVSYPIEDEWNAIVAERTATTWACEVWPTKQMVIVSYPASDGQEESVFVANARTGRWAKYTGWGMTCLKVFKERLFFGTDTGHIIEGEVTGADQMQPYTASCVPLFDPLKTPASLKTGLQARAVLRAPGAVNAKLSLQKDFSTTLPGAPDDTGVVSSSTWGTAKWGQFKWGSGVGKRTFTDWRSVAGSGYALSVATQITSGKTTPPKVDLVQTDLMFDLSDVGT